MLHRENGPAIINSEGKQWWKNYELHREDGPARIHSDGTLEWWLHGLYIESTFKKDMIKDLQIDIKDGF